MVISLQTQAPTLSYKPKGMPHNLRIEAWVIAYRLTNELLNKGNPSFFATTLNRLFGDNIGRILRSKMLFLQLLPVCRRALLGRYFPSPQQSMGDILLFDEEILWPMRTIFPDVKMKMAPRMLVLKSNIKILVSWSISYVRAFWNLFWIKVKKTAVTIGVECNDGVPSPYKRSEINWFTGKYFSPEQILICLNNGEMSRPKDIEELTWLSEMMKGAMTLLTNDDSIIAAVGGNRFTVPKYNLLNSGRSCLLLKYLDLLMICFSVFFWRCFFKKFNIKIWMISNEDRFEGILQRIAIESIGGLSFVRQRSEFPIYSCMGYHPGHLGFVWHERTKQYWDQANNFNEHQIAIGHSFIQKKNFDLTDKKSAQLTEQFRLKNVQFIISFFDTNTGMELDFSDELMVHVVSQIAQYVQQQKECGLLIKAKKRDELSGLMDSELEKSLISEGRLMFLSRNILPHLLGKASDLTIACGLSSAGWEINCRGFRAVHYHPSPIENHMLYTRYKDRILFDDLDLLIEKIDNLRLKQSGSENLGLIEAGDREFDTDFKFEAPEKLERILALAIDSDLSDRRQFYANVDAQMAFQKE